MKPATNCTYTSKAAKIKIEQITRTLAQQQPMTYHQLAETLHMHTATVRGYLAHLTSKQRCIRICEWVRNYPGSPTALYALGSRLDARKPKPFTAAQVMREYRKRHPDFSVEQMLQMRAKRLKPHRDPIVTALFGNP